MPSGKHAAKALTTQLRAGNDGGRATNLHLCTTMRQYLLDELSSLEHDNLDNFLKRTLKRGPIKGVFWLEVPPELLAQPQREHPACGPFYLTIVLEQTELRAEFLVRSAHNMHCSCIAWTSSVQRQFLLDFVDRMLQEEFILV